VILAAAFCGWVFAISLPSDRHLDPALQLASRISLGWIGFYSIYNSLRKRRAAKWLSEQEGHSAAGPRS
jgi:ABC-type nickel/cobalt efflux system permease component RcnA